MWSYMHVALSYVLRLTSMSMSYVSSLLYRNISIPVLLYFTETEKTRVPAYITLPTGQRYLEYKNNIALGAR